MKAQEPFPEMVLVKGGNFKMGSTQGAKDELPVHEVFLDDFYIGKYEVTQTQWERIMDQDTSKRYIKDCETCPVERVSWYNVREFIEKLNQLTGSNYRLPTEAEWEYAARGGKLSKGFKYSGSNLIDAVAWKDGNAVATTHEVGKKKPNELGLYDMTGNIFEWCSDWYSSDWYEFSGKENPEGPADGTFKVIRGGSWFHDHIGLRATEREKANPGYRYGYVGFRLCLPGSDSVILVPPLVKDSVNRPFEIQKTASVTYTGNEGFLITTQNRKILIDALFNGIKGNWCEQPGDSIAGMMIRGSVPFDSIDLVLVTHKHADHFNPALTIDFLENNGEAFLVCPLQVKELLAQDERFQEVSGHILTIDAAKSPDISLTIKGISLRAMLFRHGPWIETDSVTGQQTDLHSSTQNLGYEIGTDGFSFFHSGDCSTSEKEAFKRYHLSDENFDAVFLDRVFLKPEGMEILNNNIRASNIILMHIEPGKSEYYKTLLKDFPDFYVPSKLMEKKILTK